MAEVAAKSRKSNPARGSNPGERRGGRQKGTPNKVTGDARRMVLAALDSAGGEKYLTEQARTNASAFLTLLGKCLPKDLQHSGEVGITYQPVPRCKTAEEFVALARSEAARTP